MLRRFHLAAWAAAFLIVNLAHTLDVNTTAQIKASAKLIANQLVHLYPQTDPNLWWEGGQIYGGLVDYSAQTADTTFDAIVAREIALQAGNAPPYFQPAIIQESLTNFGQARWALTAMLADEVGFPRDESLALSYLDLAKATFQQIAARWDNGTCGGGLNSAVFPVSEGSKDILSAGEFFQLATRLAIKTKDGTYTTWAGRIFDWATVIGLLDSDWNVYTSVGSSSNCTNRDNVRWSINAGEMLYGAALSYNLTYSQSWVSRTTGILASINQTFFSTRGIVQEPSCRNFQCSDTQRLYRGGLVKFMAKSAMAAPFITKGVQDLLTRNGEVLAALCSESVGGSSTCTIDGESGIGEQLTALNSVVSILIARSAEQDAGGADTPTTTTSSPLSPSSSASGGNQSVAVSRQALILSGLMATFMIALCCGWII